MTFAKQNGNMVKQIGNAYISGTTNDSVEIQRKTRPLEGLLMYL